MWTTTQRQRLIELNANSELLDKVFRDPAERDSCFLSTTFELVKENKNKLNAMRNGSRRPLICALEQTLVEELIKHHFTQVLTPILIRKSSLQKMGISESNPFFEKVFWVDNNTCLRPMLAPNLYTLLKKFVRTWDKPIRIFELGPCFRKDTCGKHHLNEFTMLNLVELGISPKTKSARIQELIRLVMVASGIASYKTKYNKCDVYGVTIDVLAGELELASGVIGPHALDDNWGIHDQWVGIGFGVERLALIKRVYSNIKQVGRSLSYQDGIRLNL